MFVFADLLLMIQNHEFWHYYCFWNQSWLFVCIWGFILTAFYAQITIFRNAIYVEKCPFCPNIDILYARQGRSHGQGTDELDNLNQYQLDYLVEAE